MVFLNLAEGLDRLGVPYRVNDFRHAQSHPEELACIIGKPHVLLERNWKNPVLFGASVFSHPIDCPDLFERYPVRRILVPGEWARQMWEPFYGDRVRAWPVGIDTDAWAPTSQEKTVDVLLYDKVLWDRDSKLHTLIEPIREALRRWGHTFEEIQYGRYAPADLKAALRRCRSAVFLCEHETQGIAYQEMLASGVPLFAWDRSGPWLDPSYFPDRVRFEPVSSVPYWDTRCGERFEDASDFESRFPAFWDGVEANSFAPRDFILDNLTLEACAQQYLEHVSEVSA